MNKILMNLKNDTATNMSFLRGDIVIKVWWAGNKVELSVLNKNGELIDRIGTVAKDTGPHFPQDKIIQSLEKAGY